MIHNDFQRKKFFINLRAVKASDNAKTDETKTRTNSLTDGGALSNEVELKLLLV